MTFYHVLPLTEKRRQTFAAVAFDAEATGGTHWIDGILNMALVFVFAYYFNLWYSQQRKDDPKLHYPRREPTLLNFSSYVPLIVGILVLYWASYLALSLLCFVLPDLPTFGEKPTELWVYWDPDA